MLKTKDLIENIDEKYVPMLKQVNIPDFTKCIATLAWKEMADIRDDVIKRYLLQWAESKYRFYQMAVLVNGFAYFVLFEILLYRGRYRNSVCVYFRSVFIVFLYY